MQAGRSLTTVILALLCCSHQALAGGTLSFLTLYSPSSISSGDDYGGPVSTRGAFEFGNGYINVLCVSINGYFLMRETTAYIPLFLPGPSTNLLVAPYFADIDATNRGSVKYTQFTTSDSQMNTVSSFIRSETGDSFYGTRMMVAEWNGVHENYGSIYTTNTFQGVLITDDSSSYAVFIYKCGGMEWSGGLIGWQEGYSQYNTHYLSGDSNSSDVGCLYSTTYSAVVFKINDVYCTRSQFQCYSGECVSDTRRCTGVDSCSDSSDEEGCTHTRTWTLFFLTLNSPSSVSSRDDYGGPVSTRGAFEFGNSYIYSVYVSTNGYFSMGETPQYSSLDNFPGPSSYSVVAPFAADIDTTSRGSVKYTQFTTSDYTQMDTVSSFIRSETGNTFNGTRMMVAEWNGVPQDDRSSSTTNTFQGILITDDSSSYAVFIYECGSMEWGGGVIGWQASTSQYNSHYLSGDSNSNDVGCLYSDHYTAVVFKIDDVSCLSSEFRCYSGECVSDTHQCNDWDSCSDGSDEDGCPYTPPTEYTRHYSCSEFPYECDNALCIRYSSKCDGYNDCGDNSDEIGCDGSSSSGLSNGLVVGLTVGLLILLFFIGIPICIGAVVCYSTKRRRSRRPTRTRAVATTPATGATVVTSNQTTSMTNPNIYTQSQHPQQPVYKDAQLSSQEPPPSYDAVTAAANPTQQIPLQNVPYPVQNQASPECPPAGPPPDQDSSS